MKEFAADFYASKAWHDCRRAYAKSKSLLCERCLAMGAFTPGKIVHHKTWLTPDNIHDTSITLNWENLMLVCQDCHNKIHLQTEAHERYFVDECGNIAPR